MDRLRRYRSHATALRSLQNRRQARSCSSTVKNIRYVLGNQDRRVEKRDKMCRFCLLTGERFALMSADFGSGPRVHPPALFRWLEPEPLRGLLLALVGNAPCGDTDHASSG